LQSIGIACNELTFEFVQVTAPVNPHAGTKIAAQTNSVSGEGNCVGWLNESGDTFGFASALGGGNGDNADHWQVI
jgi:hypothetical protein